MALHHPHDHDHKLNDTQHLNRAFLTGISLNMSFVFIEVFYGWQANSLSLLADAGHNFSDVFSLLLAWFALWLSQFANTHQRSYGWRKSSILVALLNASLLIMAMAMMAIEAIQRLQHPTPVAGLTMMIVASIGVLINGLSALLFLGDSQHDINIKAAFWHLLSDALISLAVVVAGLAYLVCAWTWIDAALSLLIALVIVIGTWPLWRESLHLALDGVPSQIDFDDIRHYLLTLANVEAVTDLHIWAISSSEIALTAHLVVHKLENPDDFLRTIHHQLQTDFAITHITIQMSRQAFAACKAEC
ncbi:cation diffusion facilitator family transporter [Agitococcus lubricus]|uniref:Cobalt-zinc-cadmium efflux system protein n=1 Tax=Agitococcus lubricus TaxID=1077255 RepID=A0A2T5IWV5_9GAMM|nr:cation diffusion facilitator family transporter [Agitococcus lubricus]PTQ88409.1 cobalt-zinc-cadmium efflux system protein [Agitococcus lubricus]